MQRYKDLETYQFSHFFRFLNVKYLTYSLKRKRGFTLVELVVVLFMLVVLVTAVTPFFGGIVKKGSVVSTLNEMKEIKEACKDFYADLGLLPEDKNNPELATRFLCLRPEITEEYKQMESFLEEHSISTQLLKWDKYIRRGWRGPYMEADAEYEIDTGTYLPVLRDSWQTFYEIRGGQDRTKACIVSLGENRELDSLTDEEGNIIEPEGDDIVMYVFGSKPIHFPEGFEWGE